MAQPLAYTNKAVSQLNFQNNKHTTTMFSLMNKVALLALISTATLANPTTPNALSFEASAFVTVSNQIRVAVSKTAEVPVVILLRDANNQVVFRQSISKKEPKFAVKLNVMELADGAYELEVKSPEGSFKKQLNLSTQPIQQSIRVIAMQ